MKFAKDKTAIAIALILMFAMAVSLIALPPATAQVVEVDPWPYVNANPNPVGVGQEVLFHVGSQWPTPNVFYSWELSLTITRPDLTTETIGPVFTDATGGTGVVYVPNQVGTYKVQSHFPEQVTPDYPPFGFQAPPPPNAIMKAADSPVVEFVVQEEPVTQYPGHPLPTEYWSRPIDAQIREWHPLAGNWLGDQVSMDPSPPAQTLYAEFNDYAPNTAHVLWAKPITMGGIAGGPLGTPWGFEQSDAYEPKFTGAVIIGGIFYYNEFETTGSTGNLLSRVVAVDLHTGEELWKQELLDPNGRDRELMFGQVFMWDSYNYHGVFPYLWTTGGGYWNAYDAYTGRWEYSMRGVPSGYRVYGSKGEIYVYTVNLGNGWMTLWNSSRVVSNQGSWRPHGQVYDADDTADGIEWNVTIAGILGERSLPGSVDKVRDGIILGTNFDKYQRDGGDDDLAMWAISTKPGQEGVLLYNKTVSMVHYGHYDVQDASAEDDVFTVSLAESCQHWGYRLSTGERIWGPSESQHYTDNWGYSSSNSWDNIYDGKYISGNYGGQVWCRDVQTGEVLWVHNITDPYNEALQNVRWRFRPAFFADGKVYLENTEHNPWDPQVRGCPFLALDLETGEQVFRIPYRSSEWSSTAIIGDSIIGMYNCYDQRIYALGKGPSATTVSAAPKVSVHGGSVLVEGIVTDISPGTEQYTLRARFPNGVPAVADESMSDWMLYVHNQFPRPTDAVGVEVVVEVLDPNGNYYEVGTTTSDSTGFFKLAFDPEVPGEYTVIASFRGSEAYYGSFAETAILVEEAPQPTPAPTPTPASVADMYFVPSTIGIIIAIVVVGLLLFLLLRKR